VVSVEHGRGLFGIKLDGGWSNLRLLSHNLASVFLLQNQPSMIRFDASSFTVPANAAFVDKLVDPAVDGKAKCLPGKDTGSLESAAIGPFDLDISRIRVPTWPICGIDQVLPNHVCGGLDENLVVNECIRLRRIDIARPMDLFVRLVHMFNG